MLTLKRHLPISAPEGLNELQKIAFRFEDKIYTAAANQVDPVILFIYSSVVAWLVFACFYSARPVSGKVPGLPLRTSDYLRKISVKLLSMESKSQHPEGPGQINPSINQNPADPVIYATSRNTLTVLALNYLLNSGLFCASTLDSIAPTGHVAVADLQEGIYQQVVLNDIIASILLLVVVTTSIIVMRLAFSTEPMKGGSVDVEAVADRVESVALVSKTSLLVLFHQSIVVG
ncbi:hypothetical protein ZIOFF_002868 [Zingiber officinale]|uniref:Mediator complex subunit 15 KIX domain-containing protein n=1 Tax=Zingiber officinale TaxID=94328 RepID=A0A8J5I5S7_ZINOF|nr:hypothetical protein ZIOFF_002868 [Zingiber officinale]